MKTRTHLFLTSLLLVLTIGQASEPVFTGPTEWYVDAINGDDENGIGSMKKPFKSISTLLAVNDVFPGFVGDDDIIYLAAGKYDAEPFVIDITNIRIEGTLDSNGMPASILGDVEITADRVSVTNCQFLDAELTLQGVEKAAITNNVFIGKAKNSLTLIGSSNNSISNNRFESATESCVVIRFDSKSKRSSNDNIFQSNYFTHNPEDTTDQVILSNQNSFLKGLLGKAYVSTKNRFRNCVFEETIPGKLKHVIVDHSTWRTVKDSGPSLIFEDCYFKKGNRRVPFISFLIVREKNKMDWYWDDLINDTWVTSNDNYVLTGHKKSKYNPSIQFTDGNGDGLILEIEYPFDVQRPDGIVSSEQINRPPAVIDEIEDIAVYQNAEPDAINLFDVFEDDVTTDENLKFTVSCDNTSLVRFGLKDGLLTLNYTKGEVGMALMKITATDDNSMDPQSAEDSFHIVIVEKANVSPSEQRDWYVDSRKGDDRTGTGNPLNPFKTIERVFDVYAEQPDIKSTSSTIHLGRGNYNLNALEISIPGLSIEGTLDKDGKPVTVLGETRIIANNVKLMNCEFLDACLTLINVENVLVSNNVFSGTTDISLYLLGASNNKIQYNEFSSAIHDCVHIYWDLETGKSSNDNVFLRNYFTHRSQGTTNRIIRVNWSAGDNNSISARNRFVECAFEETKKGELLRIIDDDCNWWMVADYKYSVAFVDCYFKRADRADPFGEFMILKGHPDFTWRWDELVNDDWVSTNMQWSITGDHNGWNHRPRIQFVDGNGNGKALEMVHNAGLLSSDD